MELLRLWGKLLMKMELVMPLVLRMELVMSLVMLMGLPWP